MPIWAVEAPQWRRLSPWWPLTCCQHRHCYVNHQIFINISICHPWWPLLSCVCHHCHPGDLLTFGTEYKTLGPLIETFPSNLIESLYYKNNFTPCFEAKTDFHLKNLYLAVKSAPRLRSFFTLITIHHFFTIDPPSPNIYLAVKSAPLLSSTSKMWTCPACINSDGYQTSKCRKHMCQVITDELAYYWPHFDGFAHPLPLSFHVHDIFSAWHGGQICWLKD